jgi:DnaK suppressor protein
MQPDDARALLLAEREENRRRLAALEGDFSQIVEASQATNADDEHDPEGATIAFERSQVDALVQQSRTHLAEIDDALGRVDDGTYGVCEVCGARIPDGRLEARPTARTCVGCAASSR